MFKDRTALPPREALLQGNGFRLQETLLEGEMATKGAKVSSDGSML